MNNNQHNDFENKYGGGTDDYRQGSRVLGKGVPEVTPDEKTDEFGRVTKGPFTLRNGATYTG